ncbi:MAG: 3-deoxy-manno-octulosonate cytidylyltransferase [Planctomycetota bacterium]
MNIVAVIPARYESTRFRGKVLAKETGKYLIQHTYENVCKAEHVLQVLIATDHEEVAEACKEFGAKCVMTSADHQSGTDRVAEVAAGLDAEVVINVQGDEPEIEPGYIDVLAELMIENPDCPMGTLVAPFETREQIRNPNIVKAIVDFEGYARYFSRAVIPYDRQRSGIGEVGMYLRHVGIYAYRKEFLLAISSLPQGNLEKIEKLEQLRAIEYGYPILAGRVEHVFDGIDTPEQYKAFVKKMQERRD